MTNKTKTIFNWVFRAVPALIFIETLFFKFSAHPDSVAIFTKLGAEPFGRIGSGIVELIAAGLLLYPKTTYYGAVLGLITMFGAIASHIFILGIIVNDDEGLLFSSAILIAIFCIILIFKFRKTKIK